MIQYLLGVLIISTVTFGGGAVFIPMFEVLIVEDLNIISLNEFMTIVAVVNSLPGPTGGKIAAYTGYILSGWIGATLAALIFVVPSIILMIFAYRFINKLRKSKKMRYINIYIKPIVIGIFFSITLSFLSKSITSINIFNTVFVYLASLYLFEYKKIEPIKVILLSLTYGLILYIIPIII